jgi:S-adenosylmethionine decarboxylase
MLASDQHKFFGVHVLGEIRGINSKLLNNKELLEEILKEGIIKSNATLCEIQGKSFDPSGVTLLALLSESHASIHTYPDYSALFFDAFTCGDTCQPMLIAETLIKRLEATHHEIKTIYRGDHPLSYLSYNGHLPSV